MSATNLYSGALVLALLRGCATAGPESSTGGSSEEEPDDVARSSVRDGEANRDALGRLVTSPGLCRIEEVSKSTSAPSTNVTLELSYDGLGRPMEAIAQVSPHCPEGDDGSDECATLECSAYKCRFHERHIQRWTWDEHSRLVGGERLVVGGIEPKDWSAPGPEVSEDTRCLADHQLVRETKRWSYDEAGRLTAYASTYHDCEGTRARSEELGYGAEVVEVKVDQTPDPTGSRRRSLRYHLDDFGRVIAFESDPGQPPVSRYTYDERGRLIHAVHGYGEQHWSYEAAIVGSEGSWMLDVSQDSRTIRLLNVGGRDDHIYEIHLDERQRVVAIEATHTTWTLGYDGCPNAELAQTRWRLDQILFPGAWPFPAVPQPGEGAAALDQWLHGKLPLTSML